MVANMATLIHPYPVAQDVWTSICSVKLGEVFSLYRASDADARDKVILDVLQLPRLLLGRVANRKSILLFTRKHHYRL